VLIVSITVKDRYLQLVFDFCGDNFHITETGNTSTFVSRTVADITDNNAINGKHKLVNKIVPW